MKRSSMLLALSNRSAFVMRAEFLSHERTIAMAEINSGLPRWLEAAFALAGLLLMAPVIAITGAAILISYGRPIFFCHNLEGKYGPLFDLYKLRTMRPSQDGPQLTSGNDVRITRLGKFLRHTKLDELPTLWNVVRGEMSLVGPRAGVPR